MTAGKSPMVILAIRVENSLDLSIEPQHHAPIRANIVGPPSVTTRIKASIAACHSGASCSALGSFVM
jgi:hypothetical protein